MRDALGKADRIKKRDEIGLLFRRGRRFSDRRLRLLVLPNARDRSRMAVVVSRRHGGAVRRNRIKRLCREAFRTCRADLPGSYDYVLQPQVGAELNVEAIRQSLRELAGK